MANLSIQKAVSQFSKLASDQVHEQTNGMIKGIFGATHLLNRKDNQNQNSGSCGHESPRNQAWILGQQEHASKMTTKTFLLLKVCVIWFQQGFGCYDYDLFEQENLA